MRCKWGHVVSSGLLISGVCVAGDSGPTSRPVRLEARIQWNGGEKSETVPADTQIDKRLRDKGLPPGTLIDPKNLPSATTIPSTQHFEVFEERDRGKVPDSWIPFTFNGRTYYIIPCN